MALPEWRSRLGEVAAQHPMWTPFVEVWDELEKAYVEEGGPLEYRQELRDWPEMPRTRALINRAVDASSRHYRQEL